MIKVTTQKNFIENLFSNIWSARGLSLHGKITIITSLIVPKFVYVSSLLKTPGVLCKNVTRLSAINDNEKSGLKLIELATIVKPG